MLWGEPGVFKVLSFRVCWCFWWFGLELFPEMGEGRYFRVKQRVRRIDAQETDEHASCCGVNLASSRFCLFGLLYFSGVVATVLGETIAR